MNEGSKAMCGFSGIRAGHGEWRVHLGGPENHQKRGSEHHITEEHSAIRAPSSRFALVSSWLFLSPPPLDPSQW